MNTSTPDNGGMSRWTRVRLWLRSHLFALMLTVLVVTLLVVLFWPSVAVTIEPGQAGVLWKRFGEGTVDDRQRRGTVRRAHPDELQRRCDRAR